MRARELDIVVGELPPGPHNAITDVPGVHVGHATIVRGDGALVVGGIFVFGFLYFMLFIRPREDRYWTMTTDPEAELQRLASHG